MSRAVVVLEPFVIREDDSVHRDGNIERFFVVPLFASLKNPDKPVLPGSIPFGPMNLERALEASFSYFLLFLPHYYSHIVNH